MATPNYDAFVADVRAWSNRDAEALPDSVIQKAMQYAADNAYHQLEIPPLEATIRYAAVDGSSSDVVGTLTAGASIQDRRHGLNYVELAVPNDLSRIIHLRTTGETGCVFNEKQDLRTFHDITADRYSSSYWTRQGSNFLVAGYNLAGDTFELHYYKRLPALNAVYAITAANYNAARITPASTEATTGTALFFINGTTDPQVRARSVTAYATAALAQAAQTDTSLAAESYTFADTEGNEVPNWLRDENEKIILFGALAYCGKYLMDQEIMQFNEQQYLQEIAAVNQEEKMRKASGGNVQIHYSSNLI